jgi:cytochrome c
MAPLWLKSLPWSTIVSNAPLIVDGAKKLVSLVKRKQTIDATSPAGETFAGDSQSEVAALRARIQRLEEEQRQAAELVRAMAESQAEMAQVLQALRARAKLTLRVAMISLVGLAVLLLWILAH